MFTDNYIPVDALGELWRKTYWPASVARSQPQYVAILQVPLLPLVDASKPVSSMYQICSLQAVTK